MKANVNLWRRKTLLYYAIKFIGLAPFRMKKKKCYPASLLSKAYAIVIAFLFTAFTLYVSYNVILPTNLTTLHRFIVLSWALTAMISAISGMFTFAIKHEKIVNLINQIHFIDYKLGDMATEAWCDGGLENKSIAVIIKSNAVLLLLETFHELSYFKEYTKKWVPSLTFGLALMMLYFHNIILIFCQVLLYVKQRFEYLNKDLERILRLNFDLPHSSYDPSNRRIFVTKTSRENDDLGNPDYISELWDIQCPVKRIKKIEMLHKELIDLAKLTARIFTIPIVFIMYQHFFKLIWMFYQVYIHLVSSDDIDCVETLLVGFRGIICQLPITLYDLVLVANICASTCKAANTTRPVLTTIWNKFQPMELKNEFVMFSFQLVHEPLIICAFEFFDLRYSCIFEMISAVIGHALVVMQLEPPRRN